MQYLTFALRAIADFWRQHPALLYGIAFLLGCGLGLSSHPIYILPMGLVWAPLLQKAKDPSSHLRLLFAAILLCGGLIYVKCMIRFPPPAVAKEMEGKAHFEIESFSTVSKHYGNAWSYKGKMRSFYVEDRLVAANIPATIQLSPNLLPPPATQAYLIEGTLREVADKRFVLIPNKEKAWLPISGSFSFAHLRYQAKEKVAEIIRKHTLNPETTHFLVGIATGDFQDRFLSSELSRFGLQHLMAISGFHFAIIASILHFFLSLMFPKRQTTLLLMGALSSYFVFLGCGPSIMRAWISSLLVLLSFLMERKSLGLNSLGIGLLILLIYDPISCLSIGFQFSFIATAAILLLYPQLEILLRYVFPKRSLQQMILMRSGSQMAYTFLNCCRHAIALTGAVNCVALLLTLYYFHKFPWLSLVYNLFFPFMVSISMTLLLLGLILGLVIPPLGNAIHAFNHLYTDFMLGYTYHLPTAFDYVWRVASVPEEWIFIQLCVVFAVGILGFIYWQHKQEELEDWAFI
ncbi:MAG: ComEC/Rec2 family competence protein [Parachlamydiaceae bacterium]